MIAAALALFFAPPGPARGGQDPVEVQIEEYLHRFEAATEIQLALAQLSARLTALGAAATSPIARRLAEDLRDGMASAAAPALIDALSGRPDAIVPLQAAFRDVATTAAGRIELANALSQLDDTRSWRDGILAVAVGPGSRLEDRLRAVSLLAAADDPQGKEALHALAEGLSARPASEQRQIVDALARVNTPEARASLESAMEDQAVGPGVRLAAAEALVRLGDTSRLPSARKAISALRPALTLEEPRVSIDDVPGRVSPVSTPPRPAPEKREDSGPWGVYKIALGGAAAGLVVLALLFWRRN